jgi:replicative DNA helicase
MSRENDRQFIGNSFIELTGKVLDDLLLLKQKPIDAVPTPFPGWNHKCRDFGGGVGLARGWHITIGGNTGSGKSVFALNMAFCAVEFGEKVGFVSLEMSAQQLTTRYMAIVSGENIAYLEPGGRLDPVIHRRAAKAVNELKEKSKGSLHCNDRHIGDLGDIIDAIHDLHQVRGCRFIIVDYMQLAKVLRVSNLLDAVTEISNEVRCAGQDLKIVTVGLSQFNRETSRDREHPPVPQGLMGGSPLENDSDQVMLIDHTSYQRNPVTHEASQTFILGKNRHGPCGPIDCSWDYDTLRVYETAPKFTGPAS